MKKILFQIFAVSVCFIACNRNAELETDPKTGTLALSLSELADYVIVETKTAVDYTDFNNYDVVVDGPTKINEKFGTFSGRVVELGSGSYSITVTSPNTEPAAFDQPIYKASETFEIRAGEVTALDLLCVPDNCKVTIELSENFKKELSTYEVAVSNGLGTLVWEKNATKNDFAETKEGYFLARGLEVKVKGFRAIDGTQATAVYYVKNPMPGDHHVIKLDAKVTGNINGITIDVVTDFNEVSNDIHVGGLEENYVDRPDFDGNEGEDEEEEIVNTIVWEGNELFNPLEISPESQVQMTITMPAGIETFIVRVSDNFKEAVGTITAGGVDYIDLINDPLIKENFAGTPLLTGDQIYHQTEISFDLSSFVPILCSTAVGMSVDFILDATDTKENQLLFMGDLPTVTMIIPE